MLGLCKPRELTNCYLDGKFDLGHVGAALYGAKVQTSRINRDVGEQQEFNYLQHPAYSPGLDPIDNCWAQLKQELCKLYQQPTTRQALIDAAKKI